MSPCTLTVLAVQRELPRFISRGKEMAPRHTSSTTTASSMGVSIARFLSAFLRLFSKQPRSVEVNVTGERWLTPTPRVTWDDTSGAEKCESTVSLVATKACPRCHPCCPCIWWTTAVGSYRRTDHPSESTLPAASCSGLTLWCGRGFGSESGVRIVE